MSVDTFSVKLMRNAAEVLEASPVDTVATQVPVFQSGNLLHPVIAPEQTLGAPFTFHPFELAINSVDENTLSMRLVPPSDKLVSAPILFPEQPDFAKGLPVIGFAALQARVHVDEAGEGSFLLFGEDASKAPDHELSMPSTWSETKLIILVSGLVSAKATIAYSIKLNEEG